MAKKHSKRYTRGASTAVRPVRPNVPQVATQVAPAVSPDARVVPRVPRRAIEDSEFKPDYSPIIRDLKRIGVLAGGFFIILVVLAFIL